MGLSNGGDVSFTMTYHVWATPAKWRQLWFSVIAIQPDGVRYLLWPGLFPGVYLTSHNCGERWGVSLPELKKQTFLSFELWALLIWRIKDPKQVTSSWKCTNYRCSWSGILVFTHVGRYPQSAFRGDLSLWFSSVKHHLSPRCPRLATDVSH